MPVASAAGVHLDENVLTAYVHGGLSQAEMDLFRAHLDVCPDCVALVACIAKPQDIGAAPTLLVEGSFDGARGSNDLPASPTRAHLPGTMVGPYQIERLLGVGGMGVVYAARDPRLDRTVALKLIRPELGMDREQIVERLMRESKALARLSHPNVTTVYELGAVGDEIYVAMEYVAGTTLRAWLAKPHEVREIVEIFSRAGQGLAAAHAAGLVHRDFKPDNVLLGDDGSVKVSDFGLARLGGDARASAAVAARISETELTLTGAMVGTPAYMAPEQFTAGLVDARADQFAFCVALYEALYGERPFRGDNVDQIRAAVLAGRIEIPLAARVSVRIRRALRRGLAADPARRFESMDELLATIAPKSRVPIVIAGVASATIASVVGTLLLASPATKPCGGAAAELASVWGSARRASVERAFLSAGPAGVAAWPFVAARVDDYTSRWAVAHRDACEATRVHHQQSETALDLRIACLERRRAQVEALVDVFASADADVVDHAREAIGSLDDLGECADVQALSRRTPVPSDAVGRSRYESVREQLDHAKALLDLSRYRDALPMLTAIAGSAEASDFPDLDAEAHFARANVLAAQKSTAEAERALFAALVRAQAARADDLLAKIAVDLAHVVSEAGNPAEGLRWADFAESAIVAKGGDDLLSVHLATIRAGILKREGKLEDAVRVVRRGLERAAGRPQSSIVEGEALEMLGTLLALTGKHAESVPTLERAVAIREREYGADHALTAITRMNLAGTQMQAGRPADAIPSFRRTLSAFEQIYGPSSPNVALVLSNLGQALQESGKLAEARAVLERALALRERTLGRDHPGVARTLANLGYLYLDQDAPRDALAAFKRADDILSRALGVDHPARADVLQGRGLALHELGKPVEALAPLERALALREAEQGDPITLALVQAELARALVAGGRDAARAAKLAQVARPVLVEAGETEAVARLDAALARRR